MKCVDGPPCKRCISGNHECVFEVSNRGKRVKQDTLSQSLKKMEKTLETVIQSMPTLAGKLARSRSPTPPPQVHSLPDNSLNPLGLLAEASLSNSLNLPSSTGVASKNYFKPGPMTILPLRRLYIEKQIHPEMLSFVSTDQVVDLFKMSVSLFLSFFSNYSLATFNTCTQVFFSSFSSSTLNSNKATRNHPRSLFP